MIESSDVRHHRTYFPTYAFCGNYKVNINRTVLNLTRFDETLPYLIKSRIISRKTILKTNPVRIPRLSPKGTPYK
jgi:hypothetical protein